jgi:hypothetical protein
MNGYIGLAKESTPGPLTTPTTTYRVIASTQEVCEICDRVDERVSMHYAGWDEASEDSIYICDAAHPAS